jgi:hypothetical protein
MSENKTHGSTTYERKIQVIGLTPQSRQKKATELEAKWLPYGWLRGSYNDGGSLNTYLILVSKQKPSIFDRLKWFNENYTPAVLGWIFCGVFGGIFSFLIPPLGILMVVVFLFAPVLVLKNMWDKSRWLGKFGVVGFVLAAFVVFVNFAMETSEKEYARKMASAQETEQSYALDLQKKQQIATTLKQLLRENGVDESLIIDVRVNGDNFIDVVVTNAWLASPDYVQRQNKKTIKLLLQKINPPNGTLFQILDHTGERI